MTPHTRSATVRQTLRWGTLLGIGLWTLVGGAQTADVTYTLGGRAGAVQPLLGVNAGPLHWAGLTTTSDLTGAYKQIGVRSVRTHDMPSALDMAVMYPDRTKDPSLQSSYNFSGRGGVSDYSSDTAIAAIRDDGLGVYLRIWDSAGAVSAPSSSQRAKWVAAAVEVVRHYQEGKWNGFTGLVSHVEVGNEPDSSFFWPYTKEEFYALYSDAARALRTAFPTLKIGGPAITQGGFANSTGRLWTQGFLDYVKSTGAPLDFFSWHIYSSSPDDFTTAAAFYRSELDRRGYTATESHLTEWNTSIAQGTVQEMRVGAKGAALLTASWIALQQQGVAQAYFYRGTERSENDVQQYALFTTTGLPKKSALAFSLWAQFAAYADRIDPAASASVSGLKALAAQRGDGQLAVLVTNTGTSSRRWSVGFADGRGLADYAVSMQSVDDSHALVAGSAPSGSTFDIAPNTVQLLTLHAKSTAFDATATHFGGDASLLLSATVQTASADVGRNATVYVAGYYAGHYYFYDGTGWRVWTSGPFPAYATGPMPAEMIIPIFSSAMDVRSLLGVPIYAGYGTDGNEMVSAARYRAVFTLGTN